MEERASQRVDDENSAVCFFPASHSHKQKRARGRLRPALPACLHEGRLGR